MLCLVEASSQDHVSWCLRLLIFGQKSISFNRSTPCLFYGNGNQQGCAMAVSISYCASYACRVVAFALQSSTAWILYSVRCSARPEGVASLRWALVTQAIHLSPMCVCVHIAGVVLLRRGTRWAGLGCFISTISYSSSVMRNARAVW